MNLFYYPFNVSVNKCGGACNTINDPYVKVCVPDKVKNRNVKVNLTFRVNEIKVFCSP